MSKRNGLSARESEVVKHLRAFATYKQIAHELGIAESTARVLGSRALRKLRISRTALRIRTPRTLTRTDESATPVAHP